MGAQRARLVGVLVALLAALATAGCSASPTDGPGSPSPSVAAPTAAPDGGVLLSSLGFRHAPQGFSVPAGTVEVERVDQVNNITLVATQPGGAEFAQYLRDHLAEMGYEIVADSDDSLLFEGQGRVGGFTVTGDLSALTLRTDAEPYAR